MSDLLKTKLPKWPAMTVVGKPVTHDQAAEILIRTQSFYFSTNDHHFTHQLMRISGIKHDDSYAWPSADGKSQQAAIERFKCLDLQYLENQRICSSYIGGPHGWCDWSGRIFTDSYNIGKWPSCEDVLEDWKKIAQAFPFLELSCQLWSGEQCVEGTEAIIQYDVKAGTVTICEPRPLISPINEDPITEITRLFRPGGERGCTIEQFEQALKICEVRLATTTT